MKVTADRCSSFLSLALEPCAPVGSVLLNWVGTGLLAAAGLGPGAVSTRSTSWGWVASTESSLHSQQQAAAKHCCSHAEKDAPCRANNSKKSMLSLLGAGGELAGEGDAEAGAAVSRRCLCWL